MSAAEADDGGVIDYSQLISKVDQSIRETQSEFHDQGREPSLLGSFRYEHSLGRVFSGTLKDSYLFASSICSIFFAAFFAYAADRSGSANVTAGLVIAMFGSAYLQLVGLALGPADSNWGPSPLLLYAGASWFMVCVALDFASLILAVSEDGANTFGEGFLMFMLIYVGAVFGEAVLVVIRFLFCRTASAQQILHTESVEVEQGAYRPPEDQ